MTYYLQWKTKLAYSQVELVPYTIIIGKAQFSQIIIINNTLGLLGPIFKNMFIFALLLLVNPLIKFGS